MRHQTRYLLSAALGSDTVSGAGARAKMLDVALGPHSCLRVESYKMELLSNGRNVSKVVMHVGTLLPQSQFVLVPASDTASAQWCFIYLPTSLPTYLSLYLSVCLSSIHLSIPPICT